MKHCAHCSNPIEDSKRSTRKYCSDTCKQAAFYGRNTFTDKSGAVPAIIDALSGGRPDEQLSDAHLTLNGKQSVNDKLPVPADSFSKASEVAKEKTVEKAVKQATSNDNLLLDSSDDFTKRLTDLIPFHSSRAQNQRGHRQQVLLNTNSVVALKAKHIELDLEKEHQSSRQSLQTQTRIAGTPPFNAKSKLAPETLSGTVAKNRAEEKELSYLTVRSALIDAVGDAYNESQTAVMFHYPDSYWQGATLKNVRWVSERLRCLLENILYLNGAPSTPLKILLKVSNAFEELSESKPVKLLPRSYPFSGLIKELSTGLNALHRQHRKTRELKFRLSFDRKVELMAARYELAAFVERKAFSALDFSGKHQTP